MKTKSDLHNTRRLAAALLLAASTVTAGAQQTVFQRDFSPAEGLVTPAEKLYRDELCLNGY